MIFYVYVDPAIIDKANQDGAYAVQAVTSIFHGFLQNCFIVEFEDYRIQQTMGEYISALPQSDAKKRIEEILKIMKKRNRFLYCLVPDYLDRKNSLECVLDQEEKAALDLLLLKDEDISKCAESAEMTPLEAYYSSNFERKRSNLAAEGMALLDGEFDQDQFFDHVFLKALRYAARIEICDGILGRKYGDNFDYTLKVMGIWLEKNLSEPINLKNIIVHCEQPIGYSKERFVATISALKKGRLKNINIEIHFYRNDEGGGALPHQRYIFTDQVAFQIDPGMDFIRKKTKRNRNFSINYKNLAKITSIIGAHSNWKIQPSVSI